MPATDSPAENTPAPAAPGRSLQLTPQLVRQIADRVYALMLAELRIENERRRLPAGKPPSSHGGSHAV